MADLAVSPTRSLVETFLAAHPADAAVLVEGEPPPHVARLLAEFPISLASSLLERLRPEAAGAVLQSMDNQRVPPILAGVDLATCARILLPMEKSDRERLLRLMEAKAAKELRALISYPADSAGHLMDPRVTAFRSDAACRKVVAHLRTLGRKQVHHVFVVDDQGRLIGAVALHDLMAASEDEPLEKLAAPSPVSVHVMASRDEIVETLNRYRLVSLPVVDHDQKLLGAIRHNALVRAAESEATADMQSMVGVSRDERALSKISFAVRKRLPWLQINLGTAFLAAAVVGIFEGTIAKFTALAVLLPVVAGQCGNTGAQALAVTMRGLALREIRLSHWPRVTLKEAGVASLNGLAVSVVTSLSVYFWSRSLGLCLVTGSAMVISMIIAGVAGAVVPMALRALGQDPAQSSSIILTTITDIAGFFSFLALATLFINMI